MCSWSTHFLVGVLEEREKNSSQGYELSFREMTVILDQGRTERREGGTGGEGERKGGKYEVVVERK